MNRIFRCKAAPVSLSMAAAGACGISTTSIHPAMPGATMRAAAQGTTASIAPNPQAWWEDGTCGTGSGISRRHRLCREIAKLTELRDGLLTEKEFQAKRAEIINSP